MIGSTLDGRYQIETLIGTGGMGAVYRGIHTGLHRPFAIKVLSNTVDRDDATRAAIVESFKREAFASGQLDHPNIVSVSDFGALDDGTLFLAMEILEGESLRARMTREQRLAWPDAIDIMRGVLAGLAYAHERDIVHCDVKPDNIFLAKKHGEMFVKLLDFGIAKLLDRDLEGEDLRHGTPDYVSPEQAVGDPITVAVDLYAASVVLYEMLVGRPPFSGLDPRAKLYAHVHEQVPAFDPALGIPQRLEEIVRAGLAKKPTDRIQSAAEFARMLDGMLVATGLVGPTPLVSSPYAIPTPLPGFARAATQQERDPTSPRIRADSQPRVRLGTDPQRVPMTTLVTTVRRAKKPWLAVAIAVGIAGVAVIAWPHAEAPVAAAQAKLSPPPIVRTASPDSVIDPLLDNAEAAIAKNQIAAPAEDNALAWIDQSELQHPGTPRAHELRVRAMAVLRASAQLLWDNNKRDSARLYYADVARYDPADAVARTRAKATKPAAPVSAAAARDPQRVAWLVSQIDLAIVERRFVSPSGHNALEYLLDLRKLDPQNAIANQRGTEVANALQTEAVKRPSEASSLLSAAKRARGEGAAKAEVTQLAVAKDLDAKGLAELKAGRIDQATAAFQRAIAANGGDHVAYAGLADAAFNRADYPRAVLLAKRAVELAPSSVSYRMTLAKAYYKLMRFDDAIAQWKKVLEREPANTLARQNIKIAQAKRG